MHFILFLSFLTVLSTGNALIRLVVVLVPICKKWLAGSKKQLSFTAGVNLYLIMTKKQTRQLIGNTFLLNKKVLTQINHSFNASAQPIDGSVE